MTGRSSATAAGLRLRPAGNADQPFRFELFRHSRPLEALLSHLDPALVATVMRDQFRAQCEGHRARFPTAQTEIAELGEEPVAAIVVDRPGVSIYIVDIAVLPSRRNQGIASAILRALFAEAEAAAIPVRLTVAHDNFVAQRLYAGLGFVVIDRAETHMTLLRAPATRNMRP